MSDFSNPAERIPYLAKKGNSVQLIVKGKPFIMLGGELHNSSASNLEYMEWVWDRLIRLNCNTAIATVSWELLEPEEGKFDFKLVDGIILKAREHGMKLVILWFGTWKNAASTYVPGWVKTDIKRFPRAQTYPGRNSMTISALSREACRADAKAFASLMRHIREMDSTENTVITVQVENETGFLGASRDYSPLAEEYFNAEVPSELTDYLVKNKDNLLHEVYETWRDCGFKTSGNWTEIFGRDADEIFMAWYTAHFVDEVAKAGKMEYSLPMYANAWLVQYTNQRPGDYPSGGPVSRVSDIWKCAAPNIDFLAPDIYKDEFEDICASYTRGGNPLFIPEIRRDSTAAARVFFALGQYDAICFAPFGIECIGLEGQPPVSGPIPEDILNIDDNGPDGLLAKSYGLLSEILPLIAQYAGTGSMAGILQNNGYGTHEIELGRYRLHFRFESSKTPCGGLIIAVSPTEYILAGMGFSVDFVAKADDLPNVDFLKIEEGVYKDGNWIPRRRLNGDEYHARLESEPGVLHVSLYSYE